MSYIFKVYEVDKYQANLTPLSPQRDWMENSPTSHFCMPMTLPNKLGWSVSLDRDISFIFHGRDKYPNDSGIEVLEGDDLCYLERGEGVIAFPTGLSFESDEDVSLMTMPVPNQFIDGVHPFTSIISSSFFTASLHIVWMITKKDTVINIKSGTPLAALVPLPAAQINGSSMVFSKPDLGKIWHHGEDYSIAGNKYVEENKKATNWYRKAINHLGDKIGNHQIESFKFTVEK